MKKISLTIEKLNSEGAGLARNNGKVHFVPWTAPGDKVLVQIEKEHRDYTESRLLDILDKSPDRVLPPCPYFMSCGGCQLQHLSYESQLKWKREIVVDALKRIARLPDVGVAPMIASPKIWNYRSRIQLQKDSQGKVGFFKSKSHEVIEIQSCFIADERLNEKIKDMKKSPLDPPFVKGGLGGFELRVDGSSGFTQINPEQNKKLIELVIDYSALQKSDCVIDLYCGNGNFTFSLAAQSKQVWGIEINSDSLVSAQKRAQELGIKNISWKLGSADKALAELSREVASCDIMLVDPPRRGLEEAMDWIFPLAPHRLIYVSCNPATFARDAARLVKKGYLLKNCQPVDMFPHTSHVELIARFDLSLQRPI